MFRARVDGEMLEGKPLAWSAHEMVLLSRDGQILVFDPSKAKQGKKTSPQFFAYSMSDMKRELYREFGKEFDVTSTKHYIVVHPRGQKDKWANRFEDLYRSFNHYFRVREFRPQEPPYPLVAIVYRNQAEYYRAAEASGAPMISNTLGHYDPTTNRVLLFDSTSQADGGDWTQNAETIIHEATHQTAYNVGIHTRFAPTPRWLAEGLATMFEARGVWDSSHYPTRGDRVNRMRLDDFKSYLSRRQKGTLARLISSDEMFRSDPQGAYAEAWALSFYLCETQPRLYARYLTKTAQREQFEVYSPDERIADFQDVFGGELKMFEVKFLRWMEDIK